MSRLLSRAALAALVLLASFVAFVVALSPPAVLEHRVPEKVITSTPSAAADARLVLAPPSRAMFAVALPAPLFADAALAPAPASSAPAPEPTAEDLAAAFAAKAWPLVVAIGIFLLTKGLSAAFTFGKVGKLIVLGFQMAAAATAGALQQGVPWVVGACMGILAGLAAVGLNSYAKNTAEAVRG